MTKKKYWYIAILAVIALVALDFYTKRLALSGLADSDFVIWDGVLKLTLVHNAGAVFGMFQGASIVLAVFTLIVLSAIVFIYYRIPLDSKFIPLRVISVFVVAGAIGNLIDRFMYKFVVDFIYIELVDFWVFNVADIYVTLSMVALIILFIAKYKDGDFTWLQLRRKKSGNNLNNEQ